MKKQEKLLHIYSYIKDNLYLCHSDLEIGKAKFNSNLLLGLLTSVNKGKQLMMGEYGIGKTTSSEYLLSMIYGIPRNVLVSSTLRGNPEVTQDKMLGRLNLGKFNRGIEDVIWSFFVTLEPKIIDEFNRIPESKQNILLQGIDTGHWQYLNEMVSNGNFAMFATVNYKDSGNTKMVEAALDRFDVAVESKHPGVNNMRLIRNIHGKKGAAGQLLEDKSAEDELYKILLEDNPVEETKKKVQEVTDKFKYSLGRKTGLEFFTEKELADVFTEINSLTFSEEADMFLDLAVSELYSCMIFGQKRSNQDCIPSCHYQNLLCGKKKNCDSVRNQFSIVKYSKSLAWLLGENEVGVQHIEKMMPYNLWHKMKFTENHINNFKNDKRLDPLDLYITKKATEDLLKNYTKLKPDLNNMYQLMEQNKLVEAKALAQKADHPVFHDYLKID